MDEFEKILEIKACLGEYLQQRGHTLGRPFRCLNPAHEDRNPSMSFDKKRAKVHCFSCGATFDVLDLIGMDYGLSTFKEQYDKACVLFGIAVEIPKLKAVPPQVLVQSKSRLRKQNAKPSASTDDYIQSLLHLKAAAEDDQMYFLNRGITSESCTRHGLFLLEGRAYFPIWEDGQCVGWCARAIEEKVVPRYKNSKGPLGLWNADALCKQGGGRPLYITEGVIDAILLEQLGCTAVALCGSQNTSKLLWRCEKDPLIANSWCYVVCGDPDAAGAKMNEALLLGLKQMGLRAICLPLEDVNEDIGAFYVRDREGLSARVQETADSLKESQYASRSVSASLDAFWEHSRLRAQQGAVSTGFGELNLLLDGGFYPGLYVMGAISSLGKTSFVLQMADYIAENVMDVLFFSLEQSKFELIAKSLSRTSAQLEREPYKKAFTTRELLSGCLSSDTGRRELLETTKEVYAKASSGLFIREGLADIGVDEIRQTVREHVLHRGAAPMVVVDYLQILRPADTHSTDKQNTDRAVVELKRISRDFDIPVVAISSFNRENYRAAVSMEAFKESGAVEYSSDVLLGLQLSGAGSKEFDVNAEKTREPRRVELVILKNRSGVPYAKLQMQYYAKLSLFKESEERRF